jgi:hypothetical protein
MGRLKKDHSGWRTHGLWKKYQLPSVVEPSKHVKRKKNTNRWCKGKEGVQHVLERYFYHIRGWDYVKRTNWIRTRCANCYKQFHKSDSSIPLTIELDEVDSNTYPVQVKVNGKAIPIDFRMYDTTHHWCNSCQEWERN